MEVIFRYGVLYLMSLCCVLMTIHVEFLLPTFVTIASLPVVLYECEKWSSKLRGERRLRVFEISSKRDEVTRELIKLHKRSLMVCTAYPILFE
jgi:hypothetical protein